MSEDIEFVNCLAFKLREVFGHQVWDDSADDTAERIIRMWTEFEPHDPSPEDLTTFPAVANQLIIVKDIEFSSLCAHHLLPMWGYAHVGYLPNTRMIGLSKIPRIVDAFTKRPTTQERATREIASLLKEHLQAQGVAVVLEARHTCMACRGVGKHSGAMITSEMRGVFLSSGDARNEFLTLIGRSKL